MKRNEKGWGREERERERDLGKVNERRMKRKERVRENMR